MSDWDDYVQAHGEIIGYDYGDVFLPVRGARMIRIHEETCARLGPTLGLGHGAPVYGPTAAEVER